MDLHKDPSTKTIAESPETETNTGVETTAPPERRRKSIAETFRRASLYLQRKKSNVSQVSESESIPYGPNDHDSDVKKAVQFFPKGKPLPKVINAVNREANIRFLALKANALHTKEVKACMTNEGWSYLKAALPEDLCEEDFRSCGWKTVANKNLPVQGVTYHMASESQGGRSYKITPD